MDTQSDSRGYTEEIGQQHFIKNLDLDLGCASPGRTCNNCLFTFALFAVPWSPSLSLSVHLSLSLAGLPLTVQLATRQNCSPHAKTGQGTEVAQRTFRLSVSRPALPIVSTVSRPNPRHSLSQLGANSRNVRPSDLHV